jgi:hypothetical protein
MTKMRFLMTAACLGGLLTTAAPAKAADLCLQFNGPDCQLSGDLGFFRFMGAKLPTSTKKAAGLHGRACGTGSITGSAVALPGAMTTVTLSATFECDLGTGMIAAYFYNVTGPITVGSIGYGAASYGNFNINTDCDVTVVDCATEPGL